MKKQYLNKFSRSVLLLGLIGLLFSCEKDDICSEVTLSTPRLILKFFNKDNPEELKKALKLRIRGIEQEEVIEEFDRQDRDSIFLPLKSFDTETKFALINNSIGDEEEGNIDTLVVSYLVSEKFLYRGCGFISIFLEINIEVVSDEDNWITSHNILIENVENEYNAHIKILH